MQKNGFKNNTFGRLTYLTATALENTGICSHAFTTRLGGVSRGVLSEMNLGLSRGDDIENVRENLKIIGNAAGFDYKKSVYTVQKHGKIAKRVLEEHTGMGAFRENTLSEADTLVTNVPGVALVAYCADCVPIILLDPVKNAAAVCHSGWKGTLLEACAAAADAMYREYGSLGADILAAIGPSIGVCHFEVDIDVAKQFMNVFPDDNGFIDRTENSKYYIDLQAAVSASLIKRGVLAKNIFVSGECTFCNPDKYFSHRYHRGQNGNIAAIIQLKPKKQPNPSAEMEI